MEGQSTEQKSIQLQETGSFHDKESADEVYSAVTYRTYPIRFFGLTLICLLNIVSSWNWLCVAPVPDFANQFFNNTGITTINWFSSCFLLTYIIAGPISSYVYDKHSIKLGLVIGGMLQSIGAWLRFFSSFVQTGGQGKVALAMLGQLFCAFGQPFILNAATPYASLWFGPNERSSAGMAGGLANTVGMAVADLIVPAIVLEQSQMEMNFLIIACVTTACAIPTFFVPRQPLTPPSFSASNRDERRQSLLTSLRELLTNYNFLIIFFSFGTMVGMASTLTTMLAQIVEPYGISYDEAGYLGVAFIVAGIVGAVTTGIFVDRTKQHVWVLRIYVPIIGFLFLAFYFVVKLDDYAALAAVCAILGFFMFSLLPVALDLSVESSYPVTETISSSSLWMCSQVLGLIWLVAFDSLFDVNGNPPNNLNRAVILAVCVTMPMMILSTLYNSPNRRMEVEKEQQRLS